MCESLKSRERFGQVEQMRSIFSKQLNVDCQDFAH